MADSQRVIPGERDIEQAITSLKKGAYLLKYGRRGKPKFCPFRLANDESTLIWYSGKEEKQLKLSHVVRIIPGQRTAIFQRYPRPEKEYQSFSLICNDRSLDLICKDKDEAEVWFVGLKALISRVNYRKWKAESRSDGTSSDGPSTHSRRNSPLISPSNSSDVFKDHGDTQLSHLAYETLPQTGFAKAFSDVILYTSSTRSSVHSDTVANSVSSLSSAAADNSNNRGSAAETVRVSLSSALSSSSQGSGQEDFDALGDVFIWGEGVGDGFLGGGLHKVGSSSSAKKDALLPKALESAVVLDVHNISCGGRHAVLVTKQGEIFSWGEELGGRLGHGVEADISQPKLIDSLTGMNVQLVACGDYHTCAVTLTGDLYTWGNGTQNSGILGHGSDVCHWIPKKVTGMIEGVHVSSVSCGPWHTSVVTSAGQLFTFGDGTFGALGHGDRSSCSIPREVESLKGLRTIKVACGVWHTAAVVEVMVGSSSSGNSKSGKLFTWGDGDKGRLGHGDTENRLIPACVASMVDISLGQVTCGHNITVALTTSGRVYTMGSTAYGQLGSREAGGKLPTCVEGKISDSFVEEIACGSYHVAVLTSKAEVYTWGKGANGRLGHGDNDDRSTPTLVEALKDKQVKSVVCGSNFTAVICIHKWMSSADNSVCSGCRNPFGFRRKRHNCYNCGLVFCKACSSKKSLKAALAPSFNKPYRVCDDCFTKLKKSIESGSTPRVSTNRSAITNINSSDVEKEAVDPRLSQISRLSSVESLKSFESRHSKYSKKLELENSRFAPTQTGNSQWGTFETDTKRWRSFYSSKSSASLMGSTKKMFSASVPASRSASRATSPASRKSSPRRSGTPTSTLTVLTSSDVVNDSKQTNDNLLEEVNKLRAQVEDLTCKSKLLEAELGGTSRQLKEATALAGEETAKCKAAKEVIKSLTAQLKDMAEMVPEEATASTKLGSGTGHDLNNHSSVPLEGQLSNATTPENESKGHSVNPLSCNGTKTQTEQTEWVVQDEPGVYITLSSLPGGGKNLRRIRFSRKRFSEKEAEEWWTEHRAGVYERHDIRIASRYVAGATSVPPEEMATQ